MTAQDHQKPAVSMVPPADLPSNTLAQKIVVTSSSAAEPKKDIKVQHVPQLEPKSRNYVALTDPVVVAASEKVPL